MMRISALNDSSDDEGSQSLSKSRQTTKEAQESAALALYNRALTLLRQGDEEGARDTFCQLLEMPFVRDAEPPEGKEVLVEPCLVLKYSTYKNLGSMTAQREDYTTAMKYYLEAVMVDSSDVTVWYKIGSIALKLHQYPLARHAFEQGLECQPRHWPCIDNVITVLYALNNYEACLVYIARALHRDPGYIKGISFLERIFDEQPTLRQHMISHFGNCNQSIFTVEVDQEEADEFIDEALEMRAKKSALCRRTERPLLQFTTLFTHLTWMNLGNCLITLYDHIASSQPPITYSCKVDLSDYMSREVLAERAAKQAAAIEAAVSITKANREADDARAKDAATQSAVTNASTEASAVEAPTLQSSSTQVSTTEATAMETSTTLIVTSKALNTQVSITQSVKQTALGPQPSVIQTSDDQNLAKEVATVKHCESSDVGAKQASTSAADAPDINKTQFAQTASAEIALMEAGAISSGPLATETTAMDMSTTQVSNSETAKTQVVSLTQSPKTQQLATDSTVAQLDSADPETNNAEAKSMQGINTEITNAAVTTTDINQSQPETSKAKAKNMQGISTEITNAAVTTTAGNQSEPESSNAAVKSMQGISTEITNAAVTTIAGNQSQAETSNDEVKGMQGISTEITNAAVTTTAGNQSQPETSNSEVKSMQGISTEITNAAVTTTAGNQSPPETSNAEVKSMQGISTEITDAAVTTTAQSQVQPKTINAEVKNMQGISTEITNAAVTTTAGSNVGPEASHANATPNSMTEVCLNTDVSSVDGTPKPATSDEQAKEAPIAKKPESDILISAMEGGVTKQVGSEAITSDVVMSEAADHVVPASNEGLGEKEEEAVTTGATDANIQEDADKHDANSSAVSTTREPSKRSSKRKRGFVAVDYTEKRRSARVRNTGSSNLKQLGDDVKIRDLVLSVLPSSLIQAHSEEAEAEGSQEVAVDADNPEKNPDVVMAVAGEDWLKTLYLADTESDDVLHYMCTHQVNSGIIDLLNEFLIALAQHALSVWPEGLTSVFIKAYSKLHKHIIFPSYFCKDIPDERIRDMGKMVLVHSELKVDKWIGTRSRATPSPRRSGTNPLGLNFADLTFYTDLAYLDGLSQCQDVFANQWADFTIRVSWMTAKFNMLDSDMEEAICNFDRTNTYLEYLQKENEEKEMEVDSAKNEITEKGTQDASSEASKELREGGEEEKATGLDVEGDKEDLEVKDGNEVKTAEQEMGKEKEIEVETEGARVKEKEEEEEAVKESGEGKKKPKDTEEITGENVVEMEGIVEEVKKTVEEVKKSIAKDLEPGVENGGKEKDAEEETRKEEKEKAKPNAVIFLPHLLHDNKVTKDNVRQQLESLQRCKSQDKMQDLHDSGQYEKVIELLLETFSNPDEPKVLEIEHQERHAQLLLLMESLLNMKDYKRGIVWGEVSFNQALQKYYSAPTDSARDQWAATMTQILVTIDKCMSEDRPVIGQLTSKCVVRLTQNLMSIIEMAFDVPETAADMAISTMLPWILLYKLVYHEEERRLPTSVEVDEDDEIFSLAHSSAMSLLELVHEQLGRRAWCCSRDGELLLFAVAEVLAEMRMAERAGLEHPQQKTLDLMLEQCFYCLYGHPNRKKARHLQDHSSSQISLTWDRAVHVFEFFKPKTMPEYDSLKTSTVSAELESLLRRIYIMIPSDFKLPIIVDEITAYIEGTSTKPPAIPEGEDPELPVMSELHYLLADFYFKNKEGGKAIKFYMQDLCVNPERFDSWAGMALARASRLEQKLSMSELKTSEGKNEGSIWKYAVASLRSFQRALQLDSSSSKLWIEYGALAYQLHAHASRQLKQLKGLALLKKQPMYPLTDESIKEATTNRTDMLTIAGNCYTKAGECEVDENEEEWLHHYMLGKVAEKKETDPEEYLQHYKLALHYLHNDRARYPRKITYIYSPPHLAVETLEVFYRLHVSIMKYLLKNPKDAPYAMFDTYIQEAADGSFANAREKGKGPKEREGNADDSSNSNLTSPTIAFSSPASTPIPVVTPGKKKTPRGDDHTYSRQRSIDSARSDAESSNETARETAEGQQPVMPVKKAVTASASDSMDSMQSPMAQMTTASTGNQVSTTQASDDSKFVTPMATSFCSSASDDAKFIAPMSALASLPSTVTDEKFATPMTTSFSSDKTDEQAEDLASSKTSAPSSSSGSSFTNLVETEDSPKVQSLMSTEETTVPSAKEKEYELLSPDTTCLEELDVVMELEEISSTDVIISGDPVLCPSAADLFSPQTSQSMSQDSVLSKETGLYQPEVTEISTDGSHPDSAGEDKVPEELLEAEEQSTVIAVSNKLESESGDDKLKNNSKMDLPMEVSTATAETPTADTSVVKMEANETPLVPVTLLDAGLGTGTPDSSSEDSTTAAELERLKSEISFLNAGSTDMSSRVFGDQFDQESIKDEPECTPSTPPEVKMEAEEENKEDEDVTSRNEALEALKSELQSLSAAAGSEITPDYGNPVTKIETDTPEDSSQGFTLTDEKQQAATTMEMGGSLDALPQGFPIMEGKRMTAMAQENELAKVSSEELISADVKEKVPIITQNTGKETLVPAGKEKKEAEVVRVSGTLEDLADCSKKIEIVVCITQDPKSHQTEEAAKQPAVDMEQQLKDEETNRRLAAEQMEVEGKGSTSEARSDAEEAAANSATESKLEETLDEGVDKVNQKADVNDWKAVESATITQSRDPPTGGSIAGKDVQEISRSVLKSDPQGGKLADLPPNEGAAATVDADDKMAAKAALNTASEKVANSAVMFTKIMKQCIKALNLCLSRFPHHYKSLYRLAYVYHSCKEFKNLEYARDLLLGNTNWQHLDHMSSPGLFQDKKSTNFFQGLWRIPIEEIDRSGSFACHMLRSLQLLFPVLVGLKDHMVLFSIHIMLSRTPDQGRKYLRDTDRLELARLALIHCMDIMDGEVKQQAEDPDQEVRIVFLLNIYKVWNHCVLKQNQVSHSHTINKLLRRAYFSCMKDQIEEKPSVLEQAIRFCQQQQQLAVKSPTTPEPGCKSLPGTPVTKRSNLLEGFTAPMRTTQGDSYKSSLGEAIGTKGTALKGITPLQSRGPQSTNPKSTTKLVNPSMNSRLSSPIRSKTSTGMTSMQLKASPSASSAFIKGSKLHELSKKLSMGNVLKKHDMKKSPSSATATTSSGAGAKGAKKSATVQEPFSIFQSGAAGLTGLGGMHSASLYAQMAQMSPEAILAQYSGAYSQEAILKQMALAASSFGIPLAAMPYMYSGATLDPTLWSSLAAAQVFQETGSSHKATPPPRQSSTVKSSIIPSSSLISSSSSSIPGSVSQKTGGAKLQRSSSTSSICEPPKKVAKMTPVTTTVSLKTTASSSALLMSSKADQALFLMGQDKPLSLSTKTTVSASTSISSGGRPGQFPPPAHTKVQQSFKGHGQAKISPGLKLSAKTSQLYAVRMSSALAKLSQQPKGSVQKQPQHQHQQPPIGLSSGHHSSVPSPAKVAKKAELSSTSLANLDPLNMLATAAQSHKLSTTATPRPKLSHPSGTTAHIPRAIRAPVPQVRSIKGPPTLKRSGYKKTRAIPPPAHAIHRSPSSGYAQPMNLTAQGPKGTSSQSKAVSVPKPAIAPSHNLLSRHITPSSTTSSTTISPAAIGTQPCGTSMSRPSLVSSRPTVTMPQPTAALTRPTTTPRMTTAAMRPASVSLTTPVCRSATGIRPGVVLQRLPGPRPAMAIRSQHPAGGMRPTLSQGYGRGKPSHPATIAMRPTHPQSSDSSDDCIILSSGQDSESE